jgi:hypothetical protein
MENIEYILNDCLNKALCQKGRIQQPSSNTIADFVSKYIQAEKLIITDVGITLTERIVKPEKHILDNEGKRIRMEKPPFN